mmetsp:Transcript_598/g.1398  ORF Transcript_598/g.1398 Transcript_598/m.1398 type:complete len:346 (+) Transcript_598:58-1095(+)
MLGCLPADVSTSRSLAAFLSLDDIFVLAFGSRDCLALCRHAVRDVDVRALGGNPSTSLQRLACSPLTDRGATIREISAAFCQPLGVAAFKSLPPLPALQTLNLDGCQDIDDEGLFAVAQRCTALQSLSLYWNVKVTDRGVCRLLRAQKCKEMRFLSLSGCKNISDETVQRVVSMCPKLDVLDLTRCPEVRDPGVLLVCGCLEQLRVLRLYAMAHLSPQAFQSLSNLVQLEELDLCGCRVEDGSVVKVLEASNPSHLRILNLTWCPALTDVSVFAIARSCPVLEWLSLFGNTNITAAAVEALAAAQLGQTLRSLDVRGLMQAPEYAADGRALRRLFPALVHTELHH